jgi:hypothetical protein
MLAEIRSGATTLADGTVAPARASRVGSLIAADGQGRYYEATSRGSVFSMAMTSTASTTPTAGQIWAAAAGASTQFALWNPNGSGKNLSLLKFAVAIVSGTPTAGGIIHAGIATAPTIATTLTNGVMACNNVGMATATVARGICVLAGTALTGGSAPVNIRFADFSQTATAAAAPTLVKTIEYIDGDIILPPGTGWVPLWPGVGTTLYCGYSVTWEEIPV